MRFLIGGLFLYAAAAQAQEIVKYEFTNLAGQKDSVEAVLRIPKSDANKKALVILHHSGGGWLAGTTTQYAEYFSERGFVTLEPRLFNSEPTRPVQYLGPVFGALQFLAHRSDVDKTQISVMGLSMGGMLTIMAATDWANKKFSDGTIKFKSHAAFYGVCWFHLASIKRALRRGPGVPEDVSDKWIGSPLKIFAKRMMS